MVSYRVMHIVLPLLIPALQKCVILKENRHNIAFYFGITHFWGAGIIRGNTVCSGTRFLVIFQISGAL